MEIQSMTGYGSGVADGFKVEARSTNHKYLYIQLNLPAYLYSYEHEIRKMIKDRFSRGHIEIFFTKLNEGNVKIRINKSLAKEYYNAFVSLKDELSIADNVGFNILAQQKDIFSLGETEVEFLALRDALEAALAELKKMRASEGKNLVEDIKKRIFSLLNHIAYLEDKRAEFVANAKEALAARLKELLNNTLIDDTRLIQEIAILVERSDITEEIVRIKSHLRHMENILEYGDVIGKKLGFLVQELYRELNTIGSKAASGEISTLVVEMKDELEKIREQVQNLE
jgi:uncharacterized protein (TIGR00255 family)